MPRWRWQTGTAALVAIAAIFLFVPAFSHMLVEREIASHGPVDRTAENEHVLAGGRRITGFLVVADEADARTTIPTLVEICRAHRNGQTPNEFGPFLKDLAGKIPFAFATSVRFDAQGQNFSILLLRN